jgi:excisionase family DNA binding protein
MKKLPSIEIFWKNPPTKGIYISRKIGNETYEREVGPSGLVSSTEACKIVGITIVYLYRLVEEGKLKAVRKNGKLYFKLKDLIGLRLKKKRWEGPFLIG